ncbi:MAG: ArnT family glycosyltransferase [Bacillota bacterium]
MKFLKKTKTIYIILILFFIVNLFILTNFPFVHSDESWLGGLSRHMLENKDLGVTEPFFDLYPRNPHAIKILFHIIQIIFIKIFSYNIFTLRLISLIVATLSLLYFYKSAKLLTNSNKLSLFSTLIIAIDIHFIYSSHLARQESVLILIFLIAIYYYLKNIFHRNTNNSILNNQFHKTIKKDIILALILGTAIAIHPNSFIIALPFILLYTTKLMLTKNISSKEYISFGTTLALLALLFIILSYKFDPNFIRNYSTYGDSLGVFSSIFTKIDRLDSFYKKIFHRISGTYYIPPIKVQLILFSLISIFSLIKTIFSKDKKINFLLNLIIGINLAYIIIGRYNQTSIIFIFIPAYLLIAYNLSFLNLNWQKIIIISLILFLSFNSISTIMKDSHYNYKQYLSNISKEVDSDNKVLANLNAEFYFDNGKLLDYRNLAYLDENNLTFKEYINKNNIEYIIYPEEMDFIYNSRPVWNILYGNLYPYYSDMQTFIKNNTELVYEFNNKTYGMRIVRYIGDKNWEIKIYKVIDN